MDATAGYRAWVVGANSLRGRSRQRDGGIEILRPSIRQRQEVDSRIN